MIDMASGAEDQISFRGRRWSLSGYSRTHAASLKGDGISEDIAKMLASRGVLAEHLDDFLTPLIKNLMPDPFFLLDMEKGAKRIAKAIIERQRIGIWSDYDADGATSAAILGSFLRMCGHDDFVVRIPDRIKEGYGPNTPGLLDMSESQGCDLVCILDAGIVAFEPLAAAKEAGMEVIVIDHHAAEENIPDGYAIINPNRLDQEAGLGHLCAAGVCFMFVIAVTRELRRLEFFKGKSGQPGRMPDLMSLLDLVALGTVCDVVPLKGLNRAFVRSGLPYLSKRMRPGIRELALVSGIKSNDEITEKDCGWKIGPRINAGGRIGDSASGAMLLLEEGAERARERAEQLDALNARRKNIGDRTTASALEYLDGRVPGEDRSLALAIVEDAHEGVVGISAGRIKEAFDAPAIVLAKDHEGNLKGSARSVPGVDIGHIIIAARNAGHILKGGGHGMAGGLTLRHDQVERFVKFANDEIATTDYARDGLATQADLMIRLASISTDFIDSLDVLRPFGADNPEPVILIPGVELAEIRVLKEKHFKIVFRDKGAQIDALIWNVADTKFGKDIEAARGDVVDILATASINEFRGNRTAQLMLEDIRASAR